MNLFSNLANVDDPGRAELKAFVSQVREFLGSFVHDDEFAYVWRSEQKLRLLASETFRLDICEGAGRQLDDLIGRVSAAKLRRHGLLGRPLRFKFQALDVIARRVSDKASKQEADWLGRLFEAIDAILDSLIDCSNGVGGIIKEFKDMLSALR